CDLWESMTGGGRTDWDGLFNNDTNYWMLVGQTFKAVHSMNCLEEWQNSTLYRRFLEENFFGENTAIRLDQMSQIARRRVEGQWRELHRLFFNYPLNLTDHRFNLLADTVLRMEKDDLISGDEYSYIFESFNINF
ncbi:hypothetical protein PENTCL1PPCAC_21404, partial [Pristionchus entomophagus]